LEVISLKLIKGIPHFLDNESIHSGLPVTSQDDMAHHDDRFSLSYSLFFWLHHRDDCTFHTIFEFYRKMTDALCIYVIIKH